MLHFIREASKIGTTREDDTSVLSSLDARTTCRMINLARFLTRPSRRLFHPPALSLPRHPLAQGRAVPQA